MAQCLQCDNQSSTGPIYKNIKLEKTIVSNRCQDCRANINAYWQRERDELNRETKKENQKSNKQSNKTPNSCSQCSKNFKSGDSFYSLTYEGRKLAFCSKSCAGKYGENEKDKERKKRESYAETARKWKETQLAADIKQLVESLSTDMEAGKDISHYGWESANWLNEDQKEICRKYVKNRQEYDELQRQKENLSQNQVSDDSSPNDNSNDNNNQETCAKCGSSGVKYEHKSNNDGKKFCSQDCFTSYYQLSNSSPNNSPSSPTSNDIPQETLSNSPPNNSPPQNNSPNNPSSNDPLKKAKFKKHLIVGTKKEIMDYAKKLIREGTPVEEINTYPLSSSEISELKNYERNQEEGFGPQSQRGSLLPTLLVGGIILIGVIAFISLVVKLRKRKSLKKKKTR